MIEFHPLLVNLSFLNAQPTGITTYAANLFPHLKSLDPTLLVSQAIDGYNCYSVPPNLTPAHGTKGHFLRLLWTQMHLSRIYHKLSSSLLFSPVPEAPLFSSCRYVVMVHDLIPLRFPRRSPLTPYFRYYIPQVLAQAEHIICNSKATAQDVADFYHIPSKKITPIPLAYDADRFRFLDLPCGSTPFKDMEGEGERGQLQSDRPYFLYIGRHDPYKNLSRLIDAFAAIPSCRECQLWVTGSPDRRYTPALIAQAEKLGLSSQVKFLNYVPYDHLPILLNQALALVFPTLWEGFGIPVLEAMACGTPVITSNCASLPEVAGDAALLVDPYNVGEIASAMQAIAADSSLRSCLSSLGLARASQFSWAKTGQATVEILERYL